MDNGVFGNYSVAGIYSVVAIVEIGSAERIDRGLGDVVLEEVRAVFQISFQLLSMMVCLRKFQWLVEALLSSLLQTPFLLFRCEFVMAVVEEVEVCAALRLDFLLLHST